MESDEAKIVRAVFRLARRLRGVASSCDVTGSGIVLLIILFREGPMSAVALARSEGLQPQSLTRLLNQLEGDGLILRPVDPADHRRQRIDLTERGKAVAQQAMAERRQWLAHAIADDLTESDRLTLVAAAELMLRLAERPAESDGPRSESSARAKRTSET